LTGDKETTEKHISNIRYYLAAFGHYRASILQTTNGVFLPLPARAQAKASASPRCKEPHINYRQMVGIEAIERKRFPAEKTSESSPRNLS